ncbi:hypothetical protein [Chitinimonas koreensis]|uniref:hypothetical protein n=1 Tax=Chitinimonas koreensis TaxID=356302 RepID=UPI00041E1398|nr:hypothetical protein [Chitinimonas koreensis]QNM98584.1 hypothetical protein H9L41_10375 [Chitinimonas koreensis]
MEWAGRMMAVGLAALLLGACASDTAPSAAGGSDGGGGGSAAKAASGSVVFTDTDIFDRSLSATLKQGGEPVTVKLAAPFPVSEIPPRLNRWLNAVDDSRGKVDFDFEPQIKNALSLVSLIGTAADAVREHLLYRPAGDYDVRVRVVDGTVRELTFSRRKR